MQIDDILDDLPTTPRERAELIEHLLELIERMSGAIERHQSYPDPDRLAIEQFTDLRTVYVGQLALLLNQYGLVVQMPTTPDQTGRVAA